MKKLLSVLLTLAVLAGLVLAVGRVVHAAEDETVVITWDSNGGTKGENWKDTWEVEKGYQNQRLHDDADDEKTVTAPEGSLYYGLEIDGTAYYLGDEFDYTFTKDVTVKYLWFKPMEENTVDPINVTVTAPMAGQKPDLSASTTTEHCSIWHYEDGDVQWFDESVDPHQELDADSVFEAGKTYSAWVVVYFDPNYLYNFTDPHILFNETVEGETHNSSMRAVQLHASFIAGTPEYTITVTNGKAYSDWNYTNEVTKAAAGAELFLKGTPPAGQYVAEWTTTPATVEVYEFGAFTMPAEDLTAVGILKDQTEYIIDLSAGIQETESGIVWASQTIYSDIVWNFLYSQGESTLEDGEVRDYDLDSDGTDDIEVTFHIEETSGTGRLYSANVVLLDFSNLIGSGMYALPCENLPFAIKVRFPGQSYSITVNPGFAQDGPGAVHNRITTAAEGQEVYIFFDAILPPEGKYFAGFTSEQIGTRRFLEYEDEAELRHFTMPAEDVVINALFEDQVPLIIDLTDGLETLSAPYFRELSADLAMAEYYEVIEINGIDVNHSGTFVSVFDLDKDGNYDIIQDIENGFSLYADCNLTGEYTIPEITGSTMTFNPITFIFPGGEDAVYTATVSGATSFTEGEAEEMVITVKRDPNDTLCFSFFAGVQIDGKDLVKDTDYTAVSGSTVITLKADTLNKLTAGEHTVTALFEDGQTETLLTVSAATTTAPEETTTAAEETTTAADETTTAADETTTAADETTTAADETTTAADETTTAADETTTAADETTTAADETTKASDETTKTSDEETKPAATTPEETKPAETEPSEETYPETGDRSHMIVWAAILLAAVISLAGVTVFAKKAVKQ